MFSNKRRRLFTEVSEIIFTDLFRRPKETYCWSFLLFKSNLLNTINMANICFKSANSICMGFSWNFIFCLHPCIIFAILKIWPQLTALPQDELSGKFEQKHSRCFWGQERDKMFIFTLKWSDDLSDTVMIFYAKISAEKRLFNN